MPQVFHTVLFRFRPEVTQQQIDDCYAQLADLKNRIPGILSFSGGPYSSPEGLNRGFGHGFVMIFADETSRNDYLSHPEHQRVVDKLLPLLEAEGGVIAFDWLDRQDGSPA